ncbi:hypothetical protein [Nocardia brasiliensis]|nr:hypothetical protein [Nocardia brasiliensis]
MTRPAMAGHVSASNAMKSPSVNVENGLSIAQPRLAGTSLSRSMMNW